MIQIKQCDGHIEVTGHAKHGPPGQDIVCAGVSALIQTMILSIETLTADTIKYDVSPGMVDIYYENLSERAQVLVDSFFIGIEMIADEYPNNVKLTKH